MRYIIQDWAGNRMFPDKDFESFEDGWEYVYNNVDNSTFDESQNEDDNEYQDIYVLLDSDHEKEFDVDDIVTFQAYRNNEPSKRVVRKITVGMAGGGKTLFGDDDKRLVYHLSLEGSETICTQTTPTSIVESQYFSIENT